jgi:hypothetical protein
VSKSAPAALTMPLIPKKGEALPAITSLEEPEPPAAPVSIPPQPSQPEPSLAPAQNPPRLSSRVQATIAVTVRLDEVRYERMKTWGTTGRRVTNQEVIVAALDRFFGLSDEEREVGIARVRK